MKLLFASLTYGTTEPSCNRSHRAAIMTASNAGHKWLGDLSPDKMAWDSARNAVCAEAINMPDSDDAYIFWVDSDIILPTDAIARLAYHQKDFVTGIYFQKEQPHFPLIMQLNEEKSGFRWYLGWPENTLAPIDGCGFGCAITSVKMLKALEPPWFKYEKFSEDLSFCLKARAAGYVLQVDTGVLCGHVPAPKPITFQEFKKCNPKIYTAGGKENELRCQQA